MDTQELIGRTAESLTARRVFADPIHQDGTTVILAAAVRGGAGGGEGHPGTEEEALGSGAGSGFGLSAKPAGAFVIRGGRVSWKPAVDLNRVVLGGQLLLGAGLLLLRAVALRRARGGYRTRGLRWPWGWRG